MLDRSYGIHVAKMAGMLDTVVKRAADVLAGLEMREPAQIVQQKNTEAPQKPAHSARVESPNATTKQLDLFE